MYVNQNECGVHELHVYMEMDSKEQEKKLQMNCPSISIYGNVCIK